MNFLFLTGVARSGTTELTNILNRHPLIALGIERYKYVYPPRFGRQEEVGPNLFEQERFFCRKPDETNIMAGRKYQQLKEKFDRVCWRGDKVPHLYHHTELLLEKFGDFKLIFIARDPVRIAASWQARADNDQDPWPPTNDFRRAVREWNLAFKVIFAFARRHPGLLIPVRYESLFSGDRTHLEALLRSLKVELTPEVIDYFSTATAGWHEREAKPIGLDSRQHAYVEKWANRSALQALTGLATPTG